MNNSTLRLAIAAGILWYAFGSGGGIVPSLSPYAGPMKEVATAAGSMPSTDRRALSETMLAGSKMLDADKLGKVDTTEKFQSFVKTLLEFSYNGIGAPAAKYPTVARAIQTELEKATGPKVEKIDATKRSELSRTLKELSEALK